MSKFHHPEIIVINLGLRGLGLESGLFSLKLGFIQVLGKPREPLRFAPPLLPGIWVELIIYMVYSRTSDE